MAAFDSHRPVSESSVLFGRIGAAICNVLGVIASWNDARVTRNALSALSDRELEDIGLSRGEIEQIARQKATF